MHAALRLGNKQQEQGQDESRNARHVKWRAPAEARSQITADDVAQRCAHRNGKIKHAQDTSPLLFGKQVRHQRRRNGDKARLSDSNQGVANQQRLKTVGGGGEQGGATPEERAHYDDESSRVAIGERTHQGGGKHVKKKKGAGQETEIGIAPMKLHLY